MQILPILLALCLAGCSPGQRTAQEILAQSVNVHGGPKLTGWKTLTIKGMVDIFDSQMFTADYLLFAESPDKLRVEQNTTRDPGGRFFIEYFLNAGIAWSRRNLTPTRAGEYRSLEEMKRWLNQCFGIAYYVNHADSLTRKEDAVVEWKERPAKQSQEYRTVATRPAYVIRAVIGNQATDLYIDKESYHFLQESAETWKRVYWDFKEFDGVVFPTKINEIAITKRGESITPYNYKIVQYNVPIDPSLFTEEMPSKQ